MAHLSLSRPALNALRARARQDTEIGLEWGGVEGCAFAIARGGEILHEEGFGLATARTPMQLMSPTKTVLESALWLLIQRGLLSPDAPVSRYLPGFDSGGKGAITVAMLQTHTAGLARQKIDFPDWGDRAKRLAAFATWSVEAEPGTRYEYHPATASWVLAEIVERLSGCDFRAFLRDEVLVPLGLGTVETVSLGAPIAEQAGTLMTINHIGGYATAACRPPMPGGFGTAEGLAMGMPGAGGVGTAAGLALLYQAYLHDPLRLWDAKVLDDVRYRTRVQAPDPFGRPICRSLSFLQAGPAAERMGERVFFGPGVSARSFGHQGLGGQIVWADPETGLTFAYLTNTIAFPPGGAFHPRARELSALAAQVLVAE